MKAEFEQLKAKMENVQIEELPKTTPKQLTNAKMPDSEDEGDYGIEDETPTQQNEGIEDYYSDDVREEEHHDLDMDYSQT